jgi:hypothetical protein
MLSRQAIQIRRMRRLPGQVPGRLHQRHYQDAGATADPGCCDHPPDRDHPNYPAFSPSRLLEIGPRFAAWLSLCHGKPIVCQLTDIVNVCYITKVFLRCV